MTAEAMGFCECAWCDCPRLASVTDTTGDPICGECFDGQHHEEDDKWADGPYGDE